MYPEKHPGDTSRDSLSGGLLSTVSPLAMVLGITSSTTTSSGMDTSSWGIQQVCTLAVYLLMGMHTSLDTYMHHVVWLHGQVTRYH